MDMRSSRHLSVFAVALVAAVGCSHPFRQLADRGAADLIVKNGRVVTLDPRGSIASAVAVKGGRFVAVGNAAEVEKLRGATTQVIDVAGRMVIPGLNDSHLHVIRGGLYYNLELRWDGVPTLKEALDRVREQARRTPPGQWVRVVGGWSEYQFAERRMPTLAEINEAAPVTPVFVMYLYGKALLNRAAVRALGLGPETRDPPGGFIERDASGNPTGLLVAKPAALILYSNLAKAPKLTVEDQLNSTRQFMRELNRFGLTSAIDAGGGGQNFPDDYSVVQELARRGELTLRIAYYLFAQKRGEELADFSRWVAMTKPGTNGDMLRVNGYLMRGAGENLTWAAADFENFLEPRPELVEAMDPELEQIIRVLARNGWPFRIHATYDESITRFLDVIERVNRDTPLGGIRFIIDHGETISDRNIARVRALGGGIAVQDRMAFQGEHFVERYGGKAAGRAPPIKRMLEAGVPVGLGTDATRVASYNPWVTLRWATTGRTVGGARLASEDARLDRTQALRLYTAGSAWFSGEEESKGTIEPGKLADFAVLTDDYFSAPEDRIDKIESALTLVDGKVVYGAAELERFAPRPLPVSPTWSPVARFGGYARAGTALSATFTP